MAPVELVLVMQEVNVVRTRWSRSGVVTITGTRDGTTGAMNWHPGRRYGRWEACVKPSDYPQRAPRRLG